MPTASFTVRSNEDAEIPIVALTNGDDTTHTVNSAVLDVPNVHVRLSQTKGVILRMTIDGFVQSVPIDGNYSTALAAVGKLADGVEVGFQIFGPTTTSGSIDFNY